MTPEDLLNQVREVLVAEFGVTADRITPSAHLNDDLDLDSIDGVDLIDHLRARTGRAISADLFRDVRTVGDIVRVLETL